MTAAKERCGGNITLMAREQQTSRRSIRERLKRHGLYDGPSSSANDGDESKGDDEANAGLDERTSVDRIHDEHRVQHEEAQADAR